MVCEPAGKSCLLPRSSCALLKTIIATALFDGCLALLLRCPVPSCRGECHEQPTACPGKEILMLWFEIDDE